MALTKVSRGLLSTGIVDNSNATAIAIDSSENVLVGKTSLAIANEGVVFEKGGAAEFTTDAARVMRLNRTSSDGSVLEINKDGTTVGSIGSYAGTRLRIGSSGAAGLLFGSHIYPMTDGSLADNTYDIGSSSYRFKNLYLSGEIFNTAAYNQTTGLGVNMYVNSSGRFFRSTSSQRYKNTIQDATHGLTELLTLRPVTYKGNNDGDTVFGGLIAEEVHDAGLTEFVQYNDEDEPDALAYGNMVSLCIKAIQEQQATIESQAAAITDLTTRLTALENN